MTINEICNVLKKELYNSGYEYGFYFNGKKYKPNFNEGFDKAFNELLHTIYIVQSPQVTMREKIGTCMDEVVLIGDILDRFCVHYNIWLLYNMAKNRVHTALTFEAEEKTVYLELTPQYKKPWYGKEITYDTIEDFINSFDCEYDVINITNKIGAGKLPLSFLPYNYKLIRHYDSLIDENNDPVHDPKSLKDYMDKWDGLTFIDQLSVDNTKSVLEIGVGTGRLALCVAPNCKCFYGIDISPKTIVRAKDNLATLENVNLLCGDFLAREFDISFDVIYSSLTFMHFKNKKEVIRRVSSLLNIGGIFVLSIDKNQSSIIDTGSSRIEIFPDNPLETANHIQASGLRLKSKLETEFAYIFVAEKV